MIDSGLFRPKNFNLREKFGDLTIINPIEAVIPFIFTNFATDLTTHGHYASVALFYCLFNHIFCKKSTIVTLHINYL